MNRSFAAFLGSLCAVATAVPVAHAQELQLAAGLNHYCILDAEGVKCWGGARRGVPRAGMPGGPCLSDPNSEACHADDLLIAPRSTAFDADQIFAGGENTCTVGSRGLTCSGRLANPVGGGELTHPDGVAVGTSHVCAYQDHAFHCFDIDGHPVRSGRDSLVPDPSFSAVPALTTAGGLSTCAVGSNRIQCYATWSEIGVGPSFNAQPLAMAQNVLDLCFLTASVPGCDGGGIGLRCEKLKVLSADDPATAHLSSCGENFRHPLQIAIGPDQVCVVDDDGVKCIDRTRPQGSTAVPERIAALGHPNQLALAGTSACGVSGFDVSCYDFNSRNEIPAGVPADTLAVFSFKLQTLDLTFDHLGDFVYHDKAVFFAGLAAETRGHADGSAPATWARLFLLNLAAPVVTETTTPFFVRSVVPVLEKRLTELNAANQVDGLQSFKTLDGASKIALVAARLALTTTDQYVSGEVPRRLHAEALAAVGRALSGGGDAQDARGAVAALEAAGPVFESLSTQDAATGRGILLLSLTSFFRLL